MSGESSFVERRHGGITQICSGCVGLESVEGKLNTVMVILDRIERDIREQKETAGKQDTRLRDLETWRWGMAGGIVTALALSGTAFAAARLFFP